MKRLAKNCISLTLALALLAGVFSASATSSDPAVTRSYFEDVYMQRVKTKVINNLQTALGNKKNTLIKNMDQRLASLTGGNLTEIVKGTIASSTYLSMDSAHQINTFASLKSSVYVGGGMTLRVMSGSTVILVSGYARLVNAAIDLTEGVVQTSGTSMRSNHAYLSINGGRMSASAGATYRIDGSYSLVNTYIPTYTSLADALKKLKLFYGSDVGYELERAPSRLESLVMLIRLLGKEKEALAYTGSHPFTDVPNWASRYVAYAYKQGIAGGKSKTRFGGDDLCTSTEYTCFVLRALGYSERADKYLWSESTYFAQKIGLYNAKEMSVCRRTFMRDHLVYLSFYALPFKLKGTNRPLQQQLIDNRVFTLQQATTALSQITVKRMR